MARKHGPELEGTMERPRATYYPEDDACEVEDDDDDGWKPPNNPCQRCDEELNFSTWDDRFFCDNCDVG